MASKPLGVEVHDRNLKPSPPDEDDVTEEDQRLALLAAEPDLRLEDWSALVGAPRRHFEVVERAVRHRQLVGRLQTSYAREGL